MERKIVPVEAHSKGEPSAIIFQPADQWPVDTPGGRFYAEWNSLAPVTREGQIVFFFQFLEAGERWRELLADCPLS